MTFQTQVNKAKRFAHKAVKETQSLTKTLRKDTSEIAQQNLKKLKAVFNKSKSELNKLKREMQKKIDTTKFSKAEHEMMDNLHDYQKDLSEAYTGLSKIMSKLGARGKKTFNSTVSTWYDALKEQFEGLKEGLSEYQKQSKTKKRPVKRTRKKTSQSKIAKSRSKLKRRSTPKMTMENRTMKKTKRRKKTKLTLGKMSMPSNVKKRKSTKRSAKSKVAKVAKAVSAFKAKAKKSVRGRNRKKR